MADRPRICKEMGLVLSSIVNSLLRRYKAVSLFRAECKSHWWDLLYVDEIDLVQLTSQETWMRGARRTVLYTGRHGFEPCRGHEHRPCSSFPRSETPYPPVKRRRPHSTAQQAPSYNDSSWQHILIMNLQEQCFRLPLGQPEEEGSPMLQSWNVQKCAKGPASVSNPTRATNRSTLRRCPSMPRKIFLKHKKKPLNNQAQKRRRPKDTVDDVSTPHTVLICTN